MKQGEDNKDKRSMTANFEIGHGSITAYSRLSYTMWYALAEFIDNTTQSRENYGHLIDDILKSEGNPLRVEINYNQTKRELTIADNSNPRYAANSALGAPLQGPRGRQASCPELACPELARPELVEGVEGVEGIRVDSRSLAVKNASFVFLVPSRGKINVSRLSPVSRFKSLSPPRRRVFQWSVRNSVNRVKHSRRFAFISG